MVIHFCFNICHLYSRLVILYQSVSEDDEMKFLHTISLCGAVLLSFCSTRRIQISSSLFEN